VVALTKAITIVFTKVFTKLTSRQIKTHTKQTPYSQQVIFCIAKENLARRVPLTSINSTIPFQHGSSQWSWRWCYRMLWRLHRIRRRSTVRSGETI